MPSTELLVHDQSPIDEHRLLASELLSISDDYAATLAVPLLDRLITSALMSLHSLPTQSSSPACTVNMLNCLSTSTSCAVYMHVGDQHVIYMQNHNNCIPKALRTNNYRYNIIH